MEQLTHLIDATFSDVEKFESSTRHRHRCTLADGLLAQHDFDRMRYVVRKLFDLKLQIHAINAKPSLPLPVDVIEYTTALMLDLYSESILPRSLFICVCTHLL